MPVPPPLKISVFSPLFFIAAQTSALAAMFSSVFALRVGEPGDVLGAAVVGQQAAQPQARQPIDLLGQGQRVGRRDAAARADGDVDDDVGREAGRLGRLRQVAGVGGVVDGVDELRDFLLSARARWILLFDGLLVVMQMRSMPPPSAPRPR